MKKQVLVPIAHGIEEIEAVILIDVLRRAGAQVMVASIEDTLEITASRGVKLVADTFLKDVKNQTFDLIVLAGGSEGAQAFAQNESLVNLLKAQKQAGRLFAAMCASPTVVLHAHGLLNDYHATAYPGFYKDFAMPVDAPVVVDKNCITSQGPGTTFQFALTLTEQLFDKARALKIAQALLLE